MKIDEILSNARSHVECKQQLFEAIINALPKRVDKSIDECIEAIRKVFE